MEWHCKARTPCFPRAARGSWRATRRRYFLTWSFSSRSRSSTSRRGTQWHNGALRGVRGRTLLCPRRYVLVLFLSFVSSPFSFCLLFASIQIRWSSPRVQLAGFYNYRYSWWSEYHDFPRPFHRLFPAHHCLECTCVQAAFPCIIIVHQLGIDILSVQSRAAFGLCVPRYACMDWRLFSCLPSAQRTVDVDLKGRVRRTWLYHRLQEVLLLPPGRDVALRSNSVVRRLLQSPRFTALAQFLSAAL